MLRVSNFNIKKTQVNIVVDLNGEYIKRFKAVLKPTTKGNVDQTELDVNSEDKGRFNFYPLSGPFGLQLSELTVRGAPFLDFKQILPDDFHDQFDAILQDRITANADEILGIMDSDDE